MELLDLRYDAAFKEFFKDKELLASLRHLAADTGIILMTDSDDAGFRIRNFIKPATYISTYRREQFPRMAPVPV